ncbi:MAG: ATP-binding protein [Ideonella sp.]|nr:ATP-binding protein [Ideonella sp.]
MLARGVLVALWTSAAALALAVCAAAAALLWQARGEALRAAQASALQYAGGAEATLNRTLIGIDSLLADLPALVDPAWDPTRGFDLPRAQRKIAAVTGQNLLLREVAVLDAAGQVIMGGSSTSTLAGLKLPDGFLDDVRRQRPSAMSMSVPILDFATSERLVYLARAVPLAGHEGAVAVAAVPLPALAALLSPAGEVPGLEMTLERRDGMLLASVPSIDARIGTRAEGALDEAAYARAIVDGRSRLHGRDAVVAARPLAYPTLRVVVASPLDAVLAKWAALRTTAMAFAGGFVLLIVASAAVIQRQMTRLAAAQAAVSQAKATLERAMASIGDGFVLWDQDERLVAWNDRYVELFPWLAPVVRVGVPFEEIVAVAARHVVPDDRPAQERQAWSEMRLARHRSGAGTYEQELRNGIVVHVVERRTPDGGVVGIVRDITRHERALAQAKANAEAANEAKSRFLATMSHEMRTPLNGVLGINALLLNTPLNDQQRAYAGTIETCGHALLALIDDILDLSRIEAGKLELASAPFDPGRLCEEAVESLRARAVEKSLCLTFQRSREVPRRVLGDANRLRQVLFNLLGNALKFTEHGSVDVLLTAAPQRDNRVELDLRVRDTGIGIAADVLPRLFERFTQADQSTARRFGGSGLGLAISREIVEAMGGRIEVDSVPGRGSEFRVRVPLAASHDALDPVVENPPTRHAGRALRILVAEDNDVNQLVIGAMLAELGHSHEIARDGHAAVERAKSGDWDCILMDIQMPGMDGLAATRAIRALDGPAAQVPIVALTANAMVQDQVLHHEAGMDGHLSKPLHPERLAQELARLCVTA